MLRSGGRQRASGIHLLPETSVWRLARGGPVSTASLIGRLILGFELRCFKEWEPARGLTRPATPPSPILSWMRALKRSGARTHAEGEKEVGNCVEMHVDLSDGHNIPQQVWSSRVDDLTVLIKLPGVEVSALTSVSPNFPPSDRLRG
ncbi:hypothetical protein TcBrA4_0107840 [Trypanosoma cruzi]|nr:hypothetical protein TcBrA4_0107840 [Trypanosoma cruzi]